MTTKTQLRGHCPYCGRQQAIKNGTMAHHGYTVDWGYFNGVCTGQQHRPLEQDRTVWDLLKARLLEDADQHDDIARRLEDGTLDPKGKTEKVRTGYGQYEMKFTPWNDLDQWQQRDERRAAVWASRSRAKGNRDHVKWMDELADKVHGQPLIEVKKAEAPEHISRGEKRKLGDGTVATVHENQGRRIVFRYTSETGKVRQGWMAPISWRKLEVVA